jgi:hypothetical protein
VSQLDTSSMRSRNLFARKRARIHQILHLNLRSEFFAAIVAGKKPI